MRFVITGATSFLGVALCEYLINHHDEVFAVCRKGSSKITALPINSNLRIVYADMCDYASLSKLINQADVFVNLAWEGTGHSGRNLTDIQKDNIANTNLAMQSALNMGCSLFVESGSQAEYGTVTEKITENTPCNPFSEYGKAKLEAMKQGFLFAEQTGMKYLHLRIFSLFGENDHPWTLVMSCVDKMLRGETMELSSCTQKWNFLYVKDAVKQIYLLCLYALKNPEYKAEVFNIASKDTRVLKDFVQEIYMLSNSNSILNFDVVRPTNVVSLDPDISKTEAATDFISDYVFKDVVNIIISKFKQNIIWSK